MKKVNFKKVLMALVTVFSLIMFSAERSEAQTDAAVGVQADLYTPASGTFVSSGDAEEILMTEAMSIGQTLSSMSSVDPTFNVLLTQAYYYRGIIEELQGGKSVAVAIGTGLNVLTLVSNNDAGLLPLTPAQLSDLKDGAIDLLQ